MKRILLAVFDLYRSTGGGQTAYRAIIEHRSADQFYYFVRDEAMDAPRPANAHPIPFEPLFSSKTRGLSQSPFDLSLNSLYLETYNLAASARRHLGQTAFDVVDTPDFHQYGLLLRGALADNGIGVGAVAIGLHGVLTNSFLTNWPIEGAHDFASRLEKSTANIPFLYAVERLQYSTADIVYTCVGRPYQDRWRGYADRKINVFDPMLCVQQPASCGFTPAPGAPVDIVFIGRRERIKGPDLFADIAAFVPQERVGDIIMIGPDGPNSKNEGSATFLAPIIRNRGLSLKSFGSMSGNEMREVFARRSLIVLPSRFDTLNFVALEALAQGCPVVVSDAAGVAAYVPEERPDVPIGIIDIDCAREGASVVADWVEHYDERRLDLVRRVNAGALRAKPETLATIYEPDGKSSLRARSFVDDLYIRSRTFNPPTDKLGLRAQWRRRLRGAPRAVKWAGKTTIALARGTRANIDALRIRLRPSVFKAGVMRRLRGAAEKASGVAVYALSEARRADDVVHVRAHLPAMAERTSDQVDLKIAAFKTKLGERRVDRVTYFRELARLERRAGRPLVATVYQMRIMRWLGADVFGDLPSATATLRQHGYTHEARTLAAMYAPDADTQCLALLKERFDALRTNPAKPWQKTLDTRPADRKPRLSFIVSLYNAENKLDLFLRMISQDRMLRRGEAEVILVDSGSPTNEFRVVKDFMERHSLPFFYGRSQNRETIQAAWNRGIGEARGDYLTFLGVDEAIAPFASDVLAQHLDANPAIDWVVSDTVVTDANKRQVFDADVMKYDRKDFKDWAHYLDCTYLNI